MHNSSTVEAMFEAYRNRDLATATSLLAEDFVFTSPQDDHIDKAAFLERCFPTADRFLTQDLLHIVDLPDDGVLVLYEYEVADGRQYRNVELTTVRNGRLVETQVFFGGNARRSPE